MKIQLSEYKKIVVLTGAGVSVASGLKTYRGKNGSETNTNIQYSGHADRLQDDPAGLWGFYGPLREKISSAAPNAAHAHLAEIEQSLAPNQGFCLITQNVDGLHQAAGSKNVIEIHGNLNRSRCSDPRCETESFTDNSYQKELPLCAKCGAIFRPDIVLFGEQLSVDNEWKVKKAMRNCDLFIAIGTSGTVSPASNLVRSANYEGARTVILSLEPMKVKNPYFQEEYLGEADILVPKILHFQKNK
ncbi:MAG: NAD-dependent protein deacylase [Agarilytica sp.]